MMEAEKKRSKGSFLQLFDWNGKSRKKLFSNNPELDGEPNKSRENIGIMAKSLLQVIEVDESRASSSNKGSVEFNCASSVTSDDGFGTRAPGVVARLMGLDSLPTSNVPEPSSSPYPELRSRYDRSISNLRGANHSVDFPNIIGKEQISCNPVESMQHKVRNRPIERFQTEMLPPKSAKSIPITHHKLLSPIKNPGIVPTRNTAYIVEAAAKIIGASPQATTKGKSPLVVSSVPLRIWDLKEKMEATRRISGPQNSNESVAAKFTKGKHRNQSQRNSTPAVKASANLEKRIHENARNKGKSVSMAVQAKVNTQRRDVSASSCTGWSSMNHKEKCGVNASQISKSQQDLQRTAQKATPTNKTNNVLRPNNQKQNHILHKDGSNLKASVVNQKVKKLKSTGGSTGLQRTVNKVVVNSETWSRSTGLTTNDTKKERSSSKAKNVSRKKLSVNSDSPSEESAENEMKEDERSIKCTTAIEGSMNRDTSSRKSKMDVVSFTFSSPIRSRSDPESSGRIMGTNKSFNINHFGDSNQLYFRNSLPSPGLKIIDGDALSDLLEQKLKELTCKVESSHINVIREGTFGLAASSLPDSVSTPGMVAAAEGQRLQVCLDNSNSISIDNSCSTSTDNSEISVNTKWQLRKSEGMERHSSNSYNNEIGRKFDCEHSCSVSRFEHSYTSVGCSDIGNRTSDTVHFWLAQDEAESTWLPRDVAVSVDCEMELSDSVSIVSVRNSDKKHLTIRTFSLMDETEASKWEFDYLRELLDNAGLTMNQFALGQIDQAITPCLFNQLENQENKVGRNIDEYSKLGLKVLFDYVCESLDFKSQRFFVGSCKEWAKWATLFQNKGWLAEEFYKEMLCWNSMGELMVDDLVDKDMSSQHGKWLDFDTEAFEEGIEIESRILTSLVDELVYDFLLF